MHSSFVVLPDSSDCSKKKHLRPISPVSVDGTEPSLNLNTISILSSMLLSVKIVFLFSAFVRSSTLEYLPLALSSIVLRMVRLFDDVPTDC